MPNDNDAHPSKGKLEYFSNANQKCTNCEQLSADVKNLKDTVERQNNVIIEILAEHKVLLSKIINQNAVVENIVKIFPIRTEEKLRELNTILETQADPYIRHIKNLMKGNVERYLHEILGFEIISSFNVDGTHGKKRVRDFNRVYTALIDAISTFADEPDQKLRAAFQRQKKKYFKIKGSSKLQSKENISDDACCSNKRAE